MTTRQLQTAAQVIADVCKKHGLDPEMVISPSRKHSLCMARRDVFCILEDKGWPSRTIAELFKREDGTPMESSNVRHGIRRHRAIDFRQQEETTA